MEQNTVLREANNWRIYKLFVMKDYPECLELIEETLKICHGVCEFPFYIKGLILRYYGKVDESLKFFQTCSCFNSKNLEILKQIARSQFLLGKHRKAIETYKEAIKLCNDSWELYFGLALSYFYSKAFNEAIESLHKAKEIHPHEMIFNMLGKIHISLGNLNAALSCFKESVELIRESSNLYTSLGLVYLYLKNEAKAVECFGTAMSFDPKHPKAILAFGSLQQNMGDWFVAQTKYRISAANTPYSPHLWNNIGLCYLSQTKCIPAISCLKRAIYLAPFEWTILYNLGLTHLMLGQYLSAYQYLSAAISMNSNFARAYMLIAVAFSHLDDWESSIAAYDKALQLETNFLTLLNYTIALIRHDDIDNAALQYSKFQRLYNPNDCGDVDPQEIQQKITIIDDVLKPQN